MGSCASIKRKPIFCPQVLKLSRKHKQILIKTNEKTIKSIKLSFSESLSKDSASTTEGVLVFIVGGSDAFQETLSNEVIKLDLNYLTAEYQSSLPYSSKYGQAHVYKNYLYYIGGVRTHNNQSYPTPFMRLNLQTNLWEIFEETPREGKKLSISCHLYRPGSCISNSSLFIMSGEVQVPNYQKSFNNDIYQLDLESLEVTQLSIKCPSCLAPKCLMINNSFIVLGSNEELLNFYCKLDNSGQSVFKSLPFTFKSSVCLTLSQNLITVIRNSMHVSLDIRSFTWKTKTILIHEAHVFDSISSFSNLKSHASPFEKCSLLSKYYEAELK